MRLRRLLGLSDDLIVGGIDFGDIKVLMFVVLSGII